MEVLVGYLGLFLAAFFAATILPMQSEAVLVGLLLADSHPVWTLLAVATLGNVLGSLANWLLGVCLEGYRHRKWFPVSEERMEKARRTYAKYGRWSLLLSWAPIIGDPITVVADVMREPLWRFLPLVTIAKGGRYLALAVLTVDWL